MAANEDDIALQALVEKHSPYLEYKDDKSKIRCTLNGHELPAKIAAVKAFVEYVCMACAQALLLCHFCMSVYLYSFLMH